MARRGIEYRELASVPGTGDWVTFSDIQKAGLDGWEVVTADMNSAVVVPDRFHEVLFTYVLLKREAQQDEAAAPE